LSKKAREFVARHFHFHLPELAKVQESSDRTVKFLIALEDGSTVETVLIPFLGKYTLCLSSQVGCAMNCSFCYTGRMGFLRHLKTSEIMGQLLVAKHWLRRHRPTDDIVSNVVFMGQGEPLHNFDAVKTAAEILMSQHGLSMAGHKITISTSGYLPGLRRWKQEMPDVNIALSLHSPHTEKRNQLIPINRRFPLEDLLPLIDAIPQGKKRFAIYEYLLIEDFNDGTEDAHATGRLLAGKKAIVNLIPFNSFPGSPYRKPSRERVVDFQKVLQSYDLPVMIRTTKGDEILAACGQLNTRIRSQNEDGLTGRH
jgi:23S rRNA (adenine2503-C2)-methyltransferase